MLALAATRGNGERGDDITQNVRTIRDVPLTLRSDDPPAVFEVRGEVVFPVSAFREFNEEREAQGLLGRDELRRYWNASVPTIREGRTVLALKADVEGIAGPGPRGDQRGYARLEFDFIAVRKHSLNLQVIYVEDRPSLLIGRAREDGDCLNIGRIARRAKANRLPFCPPVTQFANFNATHHAALRARWPT